MVVSTWYLTLSIKTTLIIHTLVVRAVPGLVSSSQSPVKKDYRLFYGGGSLGSRERCLVKSHRELGANSELETWGSWSNILSALCNLSLLTCQIIYEYYVFAITGPSWPWQNRWAHSGLLEHWLSKCDH